MYTQRKLGSIKYRLQVLESERIDSIKNILTEIRNKK
jgi:hypothetical protein